MEEKKQGETVETQLQKIGEENNIVKPAVTTTDALQNFKALQEIKDKLLSQQDKTPIAGKPYINKSGWRKIKTVFNLSQKILSSNREEHEGKIRWTYLVRVQAKNGSFVDAEMSCDNSEPFAKGKPEAAIMAMAQTRSFNRAISDLVGGGEVSAEELPEQPSKKNFGCNECGKEISQKVADYSSKEFGKILCYSCQKKEREKK